MGITKFTFQDDIYYRYDQCLKKYPLLKKGCKTKKDFLTRYNINSDQMYFAKYIDNEWNVVDEPKKRDTLFIMRSIIQDIVKKGVPIPDTIHLKEEEMFCDADGNVFDVHVVGEREYDKCYFSLDYVMNAFNMETLNKVITDPRKGYEKDVDYKIFITSMLKGQKKLYLTYHGLTRAIMVSRNDTVKKYIENQKNQ